MTPAVPTPNVLVIACGALARELLDIKVANGLDNVTVECLPASYHMNPQVIPDEVRKRIAAARAHYDRIVIGYADCGTAGELDKVCDEEQVERLPGAHCYEFFATSKLFNELHDADPTAFYLTDYLAKHFDRLVLDWLGITEHPELLDSYFGNYTKVIYLSQVHDDALVSQAAECATKLGLAFEHRHTAYGDLEPTIVTLSRKQAA